MEPPGPQISHGIGSHGHENMESGGGGIDALSHVHAVLAKASFFGRWKDGNDMIYLSIRKG